MTVEEYTLIRISLSNKEKLDNFKLLKEPYNSVLDELIEFGEENNFRNLRIENLTKKSEKNNARNKVNKREINTTIVQ